MESIFHPVRVTARRTHPEGLVTLSLAGPAALHESYVAPGQALQLRPAGTQRASWFAVASPPDAAELLLLIRPTDGVAGALAAAQVGEPLEASPLHGPGFPLAPLLGRDVLLFGGGTGIAPLRAVLHAIAARRAEFGRVTLYYAARTAEGVVFADELAALPGVTVRAGTEAPDAVWARDRVPETNAAALLCGPAPMMAALTEQLQRAGLPRERILQNW